MNANEGSLPLGHATEPTATDQCDREAVASLDLAFQNAVKRRDADTAEKILHEDFVMVLGNGTLVSREELMREMRSGTVEYEVQDEGPGTQSVRVWGDTAVVTALLHIKGRRNGVPFDRRLWFSDTYVRIETGWRYAFAQASLPLPD